MLFQGASHFVLNNVRNVTRELARGQRCGRLTAFRAVRSRGSFCVRCAVAPTDSEEINDGHLVLSLIMALAA
jgi:hypothetical protein